VNKKPELPNPRRKPRRQPQIKIVGGTVYCTNPYSGITFMVSKRDLNIVRTKNWNLKKGDRYLTHTLMPGRKNIYLHRYIMQPKCGQVVDFKDGNHLNCTRGNLRVCTFLESQKNRRSTSASGFKGVYLLKKRRKYRATICSNYQIYCLGTYNNAIDAAIAYNKAAKKYHKEFACLNVIPIRSYS